MPDTPSEVFARVERKFSRVDDAFGDLLARRAEARLNALEDLVVHGCALTIVMQNLRHILLGFDDWYQPHAEKMARDVGMKRLYNMRSEVLKEGRLRARPVALIVEVGPPWHSDAPNGAVGYIGYEPDSGKCGWIIRRDDGSEEKVLTDIPETAQVSEFLIFDPPLGTLDDLQVEITANRYVSYLRNMVDELRVLVMRAS